MSAKLWAVIRREYLERVRTKGFVIGTVLGPLLMAAMMIVPLLAARSGGKRLRWRCSTARARSGAGRRGAARRRGSTTSSASTCSRAPGAPRGRGEAALKKAVLEGRLDGYLDLPADAVASGDASYFGRNVSNRIDLRTMERAVSEVLVGAPAVRGRARPGEGEGPDPGARPQDDPPQRGRASGRTGGPR